MKVQPAMTVVAHRLLSIGWWLTSRDFSENLSKLSFMFLRLEDFGIWITPACNLNHIVFVIGGNVATQIHRPDLFGCKRQNFKDGFNELIKVLLNEVGGRLFKM